jgi:hypothetical protein
MRRDVAVLAIGIGACLLVAVFAWLFLPMFANVLIGVRIPVSASMIFARPILAGTIIAVLLVGSLLFFAQIISCAIRSLRKGTHLHS